MNIATATPAEIDTKLAGLYRRMASAERSIECATENLHRALGERPTYAGRSRKSWPTSTSDAVRAVEARGTERVTGSDT